MNKNELITAVINTAGVDVTRKQAEAVINAAVAAVTESLKNKERVQLIGFGSFEVKERPAHMGRNPRTGETMEIAASTLPVFKPGQALKSAVSE